MALPTLEDLLRRQRGYFEVLSAWERRPWGLLGLNPDFPSSYDSNHAYVMSSDRGAFVQALAEAEAWYRAHGLQPRARLHVPPCDPEAAAVAAELGWSCRRQEEVWRAWPVQRPVAAPPRVGGLDLLPVGSESLSDLLEVACEQLDGETEERARRVWSRLASDGSTLSLLAWLRGEPAAALACIWREGWGAVEAVRTREPFRRRGICTALLCALQRLAVATGARGLFLSCLDEAPDRLYARLGFNLVGRTTQISLWLDGP